MKYVILDLDNCISRDDWRVQRINHAHPNPFHRYHDYHMLAPFDELCNTDLLEHPHENVVLTARPVMYKAATEEWLKRNGVQVKHILMRNNDDHRHSLDLKRAQLHWLPLYDIQLEQIVAAYDDRQDIIGMYRSIGINAQRRAIAEIDYGH